MLAGLDKSKNAKLSIFGGPVTDLCLYLIVCWMLLLSPNIMADQVYRGVCDNSEKRKAYYA